MKPAATLLALALVLCLGTALANDLQITVKVYDCKGNLLPGASVRISGCVDDGLQGRGSIGITATTNASGIAYFKEHAENSIQYCWGSARDKCKIEVVGGASTATYPTLGLVYNTRLVSPREWICQAKQCCEPCRNGEQECGCTRLIDYGTLEFRPTGNCPRSCCADECRVLWTEPG